MDLGTIGVWSNTLRNSERGAILDAVAELEDLGYGAIWFPGGAPDGLTDLIMAILGRTKRVVVATGIVNIWTFDPTVLAADQRAISQAFPNRFLLGIGISHQRVVEPTGQKYERPMQKMIDFLDALDAAPTPVPIDERALASLGPRSLRIARDRSLGTHPYFVPVEHTRFAREVVGPGKLVAPEQMVAMEADPDRARARARPLIQRYLTAPNYTNNLLRLGYTEADFADGGSDRLVDSIVAWGEPEAIMRKVNEHHAAGADHVCIQILTDPAVDLGQSMAGWRQLAQVFARTS